MLREGYRLCHVDDLQDGASKGFDPGGEGSDSLFVLKRAGVIHAYMDECPHIPGARMAWRKDAYLDGSGSKIVCYAHGAVFLPESGLCIRGPCLGQSLQAIPIRVDEDGDVWIEE